MSVTALQDALTHDAFTEMNSNYHTVEPAEFVQRLTSHAPVQRVSDLPPHLMGLKDCATGTVYAVPIATLARYQTTMLQVPQIPEHQ